MEFIISGLALIASATALFFQFFHRPRRIRVITMPLDMNGRTMRFGICNGGKMNIFITGLSVNFNWFHDDHSKREVSVGTVTCSKKILTPSDIVEYSFEMKSPRKEHLEFVPLVENENGEKERKLNISAYVQFAFPDGKILSNTFDLGEHTISKDGMSNGFTIYGINLDLMKNALRVKS
jgi:hypothetical protein